MSAPDSTSVVNLSDFHGTHDNLHSISDPSKENGPNLTVNSSITPSAQNSHTSSSIDTPNIPSRPVRNRNRPARFGDYVMYQQSAETDLEVFV